MFRWMTKLKFHDGQEATVLSVSRPFVQTVGTELSAMLRISSYDGEMWFPFPAKTVEVEEVHKEGILETLHEKDITQITQKAFEFKESDNPDDHVLGDIILQAVKFYQVAAEVMEQEVSANEASKE